MQRFSCLSFSTDEREAALKAYEEFVRIPTRASRYSAGYDFVTPFSLGIGRGETVTVPTGIKCFMGRTDIMRNRENYEVFLQMHVRSSIGIRHGIVLSNCTGIIDADYYNNPDNEGDIHLALWNRGDNFFECKAGDRIAQGILIPYFTTDNEVFPEETRSGGIGSSGK